MQKTAGMETGNRGVRRSSFAENELVVFLSLVICISCHTVDDELKHSYFVYGNPTRRQIFVAESLLYRRKGRIFNFFFFLVSAACAARMNDSHPAWIYSPRSVTDIV